MDVQNVIEDAWSKGIQVYDLQKTPLALPFRINFTNLTEIRHPNGPIKHIRRTQQAPYPSIKIVQEIPLHGALNVVERTTAIVNSAPPDRAPSNAIVATCVNQTKPPPLPPSHSKPKKLFPHLGKSKPQMPLPAPPDMPIQSTSSSTVSSNSTSANLARQIFNNLNIFSHHKQNHSNSNGNHQSSQKTFALPEPMLVATTHSMERSSRRLSNKSTSSTASTQNLLTTRRCRRSIRSQDDLYLDGNSSVYTTSSIGVGSRRPSVDTISTYLSHDSNELLQYGSRESSYGGSNNCSADRSCADATVADDDDVFLPSLKGSIVGVDADSDNISRFVSVVQPPKWPSCRPCAMCLEELRHDPNNPAVSLIRCEHMMHLNCLNHLIISQSEEQQRKQPAKTKSLNLFIECPVCGIVYGEKYGNQPPGTMSWTIIPKQLAGHEGQNTIQITYK